MEITGVSCQMKRMFYSSLFFYWSFRVMKQRVKVKMIDKMNDLYKGYTCTSA